MSLLAIAGLTSSSDLPIDPPAKAETYLQRFTDEIRATLALQEFLEDSKLPCKEINAILNTLIEIGHVAIDGSDVEQRPTLVGLQKVFENQMSIHLQSGELTAMVGSIHTPNPSTPLCTEELAHPDIVADPNRLVTIAERVESLQKVLTAGGRIYCVYSEKRPKEAQQAIYEKNVKDHPATLLDIPLTTPLPDSMIGATYVMTSKKGEHTLFSLKASQANAPKEQDRDWELWLGPLDSHQERLQEVLRAIQNCGGPDLTGEFPAMLEKQDASISE